MLDTLRTTLHRVLVTSVGDGIAPLRIQKELARRLNVALGEPICSADALAKRRAARARLASLANAPGTTTLARDAAPVTVYFERDRNVRDLQRIRELLGARGLAFKELDVAGDEATLDFVTRAAAVKSDELPVVFVGPRAVGDLRALVAFDASGELARATRGA